MPRLNVYRERSLWMIAGLLMCGCTPTSSPVVSDASQAQGTPERGEVSTNAIDDSPRDLSQGPIDLNSPDSSAVVPKTASGDNAGNSGSDSDEPRNDRPAASDPAAVSGSQPATRTANDISSPQDGRPADGDDPKAPWIDVKKARAADAPLNNGREPAAKPLPEGQRIASDPASVEPSADSVGRAAGVKPGAEVVVEPQTRPETPKRTTLADLSAATKALDKDGDGQIGLYEWPREKIADFKTLDTNKDGFLTPTELSAGEKKNSKATAKPEDAAKKDATEKDATEKDASKPAEPKTKAEDPQPAADKPKAANKEAKPAPADAGAGNDQPATQGS